MGLFCLGVAIAAGTVACSDSARPPFIKAQVIDVYNKKTDIYNAHFLYWWQERGETAFLDTHEYTSRILMACTPTDGAGDIGTTTPSSTLTPVRIHLQEIGLISWIMSGTGKKMQVHLKNDDVIETQCVFPRELLVDRQAGLADYRCYITGSTTGNNTKFDFRQAVDFLAEIRITGVDG